MGLRVEVAASPAVATSNAVVAAATAGHSVTTSSLANDEVFALLADDDQFDGESRIALLSRSHDDLFDRWRAVDGQQDADDSDLDTGIELL